MSSTDKYTNGHASKRSAESRLPRRMRLCAGVVTRTHACARQAGGVYDYSCRREGPCDQSFGSEIRDWALRSLTSGWGAGVETGPLWGASCFRRTFFFVFLRLMSVSPSIALASSLSPSLMPRVRRSPPFCLTAAAIAAPEALRRGRLRKVEAILGLRPM